MPADAGRDAEISALETLFSALEPLDDDARARVLEYTLRRLGMHELPTGAPPLTPALLEPSVPPPLGPGSGVVDIRTLREQKTPSSANEMAAIAAYYLAETAPKEDRKDTVTTADIERLFKQAGYRLPSRIAMTLPNAAAAGYFDKAGTGEYRLNPVGHNLVTQSLPRASGRATPPKRKRATTTARSKPKSASAKTKRTR